MARVVATRTALSVRADALTGIDEKSTPSAPTIDLKNRVKPEARLRTLEAQGDVTGIRGFATGPKIGRYVSSSIPPHLPITEWRMRLG